jgi:hypothetical protein
MDRHVCDAHLDVTGFGPLTLSRVLRLQLAHLDPDTDITARTADLLQEVKDCPRCLVGMLLMTAGKLAELLMEEGPRADVVADLDRQLSEALDQLAAED